MMSIPEGVSRCAVYTYGRDSSCSMVISAVCMLASSGTWPSTWMLELPPVLVPGMTPVYTCALRAAGPSSNAVTVRTWRNDIDSPLSSVDGLQEAGGREQAPTGAPSHSSDRDRLPPASCLL